MRYALFLILACLVLATPVLAVVFPCSNNDSGNAYTGSNAATYGVVMVKTIPSNATVTLNPGTNFSYSGTSTFLSGDSPGTHSFSISLSGYKDYAGQFAICTKKMTYVEVSLSSEGLNNTYRRTGSFVGISTIAPVQGTTTLPVRAVTTVTQSASATTSEIPVAAGTSAPQDTLGSLNVKTDPAGATIMIDGVMRGASPATIPGLSAGSHTLLLKLDGYQDMSTPLTITAGKTQDYSTAMIKNAAAGASPAVTESATATPKKSPGFVFVSALVAMVAIIVMKRLL
jgi:hypothetical protein